MADFEDSPNPYAADNDRPTPAPGGQAGPTQGSLHCVRCGYNLSGTAIGGTCPECGTPIGQTLATGGKPTSGYSIASMVLGICGIAGCMCYGIPTLICGILAIVFYFVAQPAIQEDRVSANSRSFALTGLITGIIGLALIAVGIIAGIIIAILDPH